VVQLLAYTYERKKDTSSEMQSACKAVTRFLDAEEDEALKE